MPLNIPTCPGLQGAPHQDRSAGRDQRWANTCVIGELSQIGMFGFFCCEAFLWNKVSLFHSQGVTSAHTFAFFVPDKFFVSGYFYLHSSKQHAQNIAPVWTGLNISFSVTLEHRLSIRGAPWRPPGPPGAPMTPGMSSWAIVSHPGSLWVIFDPSGVNNSSVSLELPPAYPQPQHVQLRHIRFWHFRMTFF